MEEARGVGGGGVLFHATELGILLSFFSIIKMGHKNGTHKTQVLFLEETRTD